MEPKVNYTLVGLFIALLGAAMLAGALWLSQTDYRGVYERYYTYLDESVTGLSVDSYVKYRGVDVGRIKEIALTPDNPDQVRLALDIRHGTPIKEDTVASLEKQGLTGITIVGLSGGSRNSPLLKPEPGEHYPVIKSQPSFYTQLAEGLSHLIANEQLPALLANLNSLTEEARGRVDAESLADLKRILADLARVTGVLAAHRAELANSIAQSDAAFESLAAVGKKLDDRLPELLDLTTANLRSLQHMTDQVATASASVRSAVEDNRAEVEQFTGATLAEAGTLIAEVRQLAATLQQLASDLEREPSTLIYGRPRPLPGPGE